ncbi:MAG TPA: ABC transporter permease [Actinomycetota bacterium]|jgi:ABC transporter DrrB family efflux protein|nr:ABC transporter permease [Actinomycetota bacterium]
MSAWPAARDGRLRWMIADCLVIAKRHLLHLRHNPRILLLSTLQSSLFIVMFAYVFGGAIPLPGGGSYREYLVAGIFVQIVVFSSAGTGVGLAEDLQKGIVDRFRSLPISPVAVLMGRTIADLARSGLSLVSMLGVAVLVGWRIHEGVLRALAAFGMFLLFSYAVSWIGVVVGLSAANAETANTIAAIWLFPMTFMSNTFVPTQGMPHWLRAVAEWNPVSAVVAAGRAMFGNPSLTVVHGASFPMRQPVVASVLWSLLVPAVVAPLAVWRFRRALSR